MPFVPLVSSFGNSAASRDILLADKVVLDDGVQTDGDGVDEVI